MTGPYALVQAALITRMQAIPGLAEVTGIYDGPPPRAAFPYISIGTSLITDWSTKTESGRDIRLALTLWDAGDAPARFHRLLPEIESGVAGLPRLMSGWQVASLTHVRTLLDRDPQGPWAGLVEHRIRLLQL
jgi:hypothetical protein